jgi:hypothetical protein
VKPRRPKVKVAATLELDAYRILCDAVEAGVARGLVRAWKHREPPTGWTPEIERHVQEIVSGCVTNGIAELMKVEAE